MSLLSLCGELRDSAADRQGVGYSRDQAGQVVAVTGANRGGERVYAQKIRYRSSGLVKQVSYGNGRQLSVAYDNRLRVSRWEVGGVLGWEYEYDNFGERSGRATACAEPVRRDIGSELGVRSGGAVDARLQWGGGAGARWAR